MRGFNAVLAASLTVWGVAASRVGRSGRSYEFKVPINSDGLPDTDSLLRDSDDIVPGTVWPQPANMSVGSSSVLLPASDFGVVPVGYSDDIIGDAIYRVGGYLTNPWPINAANVNGAPVMSQLLVNITSSNTQLDEFVDETYALTIPADGSPAIITARTVYGAIYGLETFSQLVQYNFTSQTYFITGPVSISDAPRFPYRGVLLDTARHYLEISAIKAAIDLMGHTKLNVLHIHLSDDDAWPLIVEAAPLLAVTGAYSNHSHTYSRADIQDLTDYARKRAVRLLPEFDTPSHFGTLMQAYPQYAASAIDPNSKQPFLCMVDPSKNETFEFIESIWRDIATTFNPSPQIMLGGDEFWQCWSDSPNVSAWMTAQGFSLTDAYYYYEQRMVNISRAMGKRSVLWVDAAGYPPNYPNNKTYGAFPDVTINVWSGCYSGNWQIDTGILTSQQSKVVVSGPYYITQQNGAPNTPHFTWVDMYQTDLWNYTIPDGSAPTPQMKALVQGGELCAWGDASQTDSGDIVSGLTPYVFGVSEAWWSPQSVTSGQSPDETRAHNLRCRIGLRGYATHPIFWYGAYCPQEYITPLSA